MTEEGDELLRDLIEVEEVRPMKITNMDMTYCTKLVKSNICKKCKRNYDLYEKESNKEKHLWMSNFSEIPLENCSMFLKMKEK